MVRRQDQRLGPGGFCVCVKCEHRVPHERGTPCLQMRCPTCGGRMVREGSAHDEARKQRRSATAKA
jgi:PHP family Zn ribbon phosphoesterase